MNKYSSFNTRSLPFLRQPRSLSPICLAYLGFVCGGDSGLQAGGSCWGLQNECSSGSISTALSQATTYLLVTALRGIILNMV